VLHSATYTGAAIVIAVSLRRRTRTVTHLGLLRRLRPQLLVTPLVAAAGIAAGRAVPLDGRPVALVGALGVGAAIVGAHLIGSALLGGLDPRHLARSLAGADR
jgi:hypothetical protein